jgi:NADH-quinone oxidoreductase subunit N
MAVMGRSLIIQDSVRSLVALIYGSLTVWFVVMPFTSTTRRFTSFSLAITSLLIAALSVKPFLYASLLIEMAVLFSIPLMVPLGSSIGRGVIRFLVFQTLSMPFILFSGWLLAGIESNPGNINLVQQAAFLVGLGFIFLLGIFPFYSWIPLIGDEVSPHIAGFILWIFPTIALVFGLGFLDGYPWLRELPGINSILLVAGMMMVVFGGFLIMFQKHMGRAMGYMVMMETGFSILSITTRGDTGLDVFLLFLVPRILGLLLCSLSLEVLIMNSYSLQIDDLKGILRIYPFTASGILFSAFSILGLPLLAGFPPRQALWHGLATTSLSSVGWVLIGCIGLFIFAAKVLTIMVSAPEGTRWESRETWTQRILLTIGMLMMILLGLFPDWVLPLWNKLPTVFPHLGS